MRATPPQAGGTPRGLRQVPTVVGMIWRLLGCGLLTLLPMSTLHAQARPLAVLGDSDSQGYQDRLWMPEGRGGPWAERTFQWTEWLARWRSAEWDLGPVGIWGDRKWLARGLDLLGLASRAPRKLDNRHNFAIAGEGCRSLTEGIYRQAPRLADLMDEQRERWRSGLVVIRIGVVDFGYADSLDALAHRPDDPGVRARMDRCLAHISAAVTLLQQRHPDTHLLLIGIFNNAHWTAYLDRWQDPAQLRRIDQGLDHFDQGLQAIVERDSKHLSFYSDRAAFRTLWGDRDDQGRPAYRTLSFGPVKVQMSQGDAPGHAILADGHVGSLWNLAWAQGLLGHVHRQWGWTPTPFTAAEMAEAGQLVLGEAGSRAPDVR